MRFKGGVGRGILTFKVGKTQFRGLCLSPLSRALGQLSKYEIKKGGHFILRQSLKDLLYRKRLEKMKGLEKFQYFDESQF